MGWRHGSDIHSSHVAVELRPHVGTLSSGEEVEHNQWIVVVKVDEYFGPKQVGYLHKGQGSQLATISEWNKIPRGDRPAVLQEISRQAGWEVTAIEYPVR